ncbi:MAG TPA: hypothetical protein DE276_07170 [Oceanospirillaceae bacterium]|nr:hypothetical protein [Oceanospirillaceae bacterium]
MAISITKPSVGGSQDSWGQTINDALDTIVNGVNGTSGTVSPDLSALKINGTTVTSTPQELNKLDGYTGDHTDLNLLDGAVSNTVVNSKAVVYGPAGEVQATTIDLGNWTITESSNILYFATSGTNKMKLDASGNLTVVGNITAYGTM